MKKIVESNPEMFAELDSKIREMSDKINVNNEEFDVDDDDDDNFDIRTLKSGADD